MQEKYRPIPGFPGYDISNFGTVRSYKKCTGISDAGPQWEIMDKPQKILSQCLGGGTYLFVMLCKDGVRYPRRVHNLVLLAFVGPPPDGMEACHNDSDPRNNRLDNLRYDTHQGNLEDKEALTRRRVRQIRHKANRGATMATLADEYGMSKSHVRAICRGYCHKNAGGPLIPGRRLSPEQVIEIRTRRAGGETLLSIANDYGYTESAISLICRGKRFENVGGPLTHSVQSGRTAPPAPIDGDKEE
jgi:uncharacterized protein (DUF433 family)